MKKTILLCLALSGLLFGKSAGYDELINELTKQARMQNPSFAGFSKTRGEQIFYAEKSDKNGAKISCTTCHQSDLRQKGKNPTTGKIIEPLAPSANATRLTDKMEIEKWLKRNFKQVYGREGTAVEKGDVLEFISSK